MEGRRVASGILRATAGTCSLAAEARALGVSPSRVEDWADSEHDAAMALGDLLGGRIDFAEHVLVAALAHVHTRRLGRAAELPQLAQVLHLSSAAAGVAAHGAMAAADGKIDAGERSDLLKQIATLEHELADARRALQPGNG